MKNDLRAIKLQIIPILKKADVSRSFVFGSYARGEANDQSDLDLIVEFGERKSLLDVAELYVELRERLGMDVDLLTPDAISPYLKKYIEQDKIRIL
jgi:predicted nucleotidyltransferase